MDLQQEINTMVRRAIMEEINNLAVRATIREKIEAAGISDNDIKTMVKETVDSYIRSAMNGNVKGQIENIFKQKVTETVETEIKAVVGRTRTWSGSDEVRKALNEEIARATRNGFEVSVQIKPKEG